MASYRLARRNLRNRLRVRAATPGNVLAATAERDAVQIKLGPPQNYEANEVISILGNQSADQDFAAMQGAKRQTFEIRGRIKCYNPSTAEDDDQIDALDDRAWAMFDEVVRTVEGVDGNDVPTGEGYNLDGAVLWAIAAPIAGEDGPLPAPPPTPGWSVVIPFVVRCEAQS
jgi:hypothetical protein